MCRTSEINSSFPSRVIFKQLLLELVGLSIIVPSVAMFLVTFLLSFFNVEKELPQIKKEIEERRQQGA